MDTIRIGTFRYDTTRALFDGSVTVEGVRNTQMETAPTLVDIFEGMLRRSAYDFSELGLTFLLRALDQGEPLVALPAFPARVFRHSCVFVNTDSGITGPADLVGRTIGEFGVYGQDSGVWAKGALMDDFGFAPEKNRWVIGGLEHPTGPFDFTSHPHPDDVEVTTAPEGKTLGAMLAAGEIDALFTANVPQCYLDGAPTVTRLFPDYQGVERDYYRRTGIFPMMHTVVARRDLLDAHPGLARRVYQAFLASKDAAEERYRHDARWFEVQHVLPWTNALFEDDRRLMGEDWWPYGTAANRHAVDTFLRHHHEQGLSARRWTVDEVFSPDLLDT
jgi:4,5-dihydroxyphthalate decarboxylase